ncbi:Transcription initiation factor TFIID subunit 1 [Bonamia ostreae]|uniref:Transcription initiation factor TFIID subunit 1 n=1 Tax=Bonamia ostreae TaxID=126728 RepID=A0ABV2APM9_9EUKA
MVIFVNLELITKQIWELRPKKQTEEYKLICKKYRKTRLNKNQTIALKNFLTNAVPAMKYSEIFQNRVDLKSYPDYENIVAHHISLSDIISNITLHKYDSIQGIFSDIQQIAKNSILYNGIDFYVTENALKLSSFIFDNLVNFILKGKSLCDIFRSEKVENDGLLKKTLLHLGYMKSIVSIDRKNTENKYLNIIDTIKSIFYDRREMEETFKEIKQKILKREYFNLNELKNETIKEMMKNGSNFKIDRAIKKFDNLVLEEILKKIDKDCLIGVSENQRTLRNRFK